MVRRRRTVREGRWPINARMRSHAASPDISRAYRETHTPGQRRAAFNRGMSTRRRPPAALALIAVVALVAACGSGAPAGSTGATGGAGSGGTGTTTTVTAQDKAVKLAECIRAHGVPHFPDPDAKGEFAFGIDVSPAVWQRAVDACKALEPPGRLQRKAEPEAAVGCPQVRRVRARARREGLPGPRQRRPAHRHDEDPVLQPARRHDHPQRRDARSAAAILKLAAGGQG